MLAFFSTILLVPIALIIGAYFLFQERETRASFYSHVTGLSFREVGVMVGAQFLIAIIASAIVYSSNTSDTEIHNGRVASKEQKEVSCEHSYSCNCTEMCTGGKTNSCQRICQTCYEHPYDYNWNVYTSNDETITINRVDSQGVDEPPRFTRALVGEPTAVQHSYTNYVKASPDSLFRHQGLVENHKHEIPPFPQDVYDYYRYDRLVTVGTKIDDKERKDWNSDLSELNASLGANKQINVIVIIGKNKSREWYYALEEAWIGGKKNDAIIVISVDAQRHPQWAQVMAWTTNDMFKVKLKDDIMDESFIDRETVMKAIHENVVRYYKRKPMHDFEYLKSLIVPSTAEYIITLIISFLLIGTLMKVCYDNQFFE